MKNTKANAASVVLFAAIVPILGIIACLAAASDYEAPTPKFVQGQLVRIEASGGKAIVVKRYGSNRYMVRYSDHQGVHHEMVVEEFELEDWPGPYAIR